MDDHAIKLKLASGRRYALTPTQARVLANALWDAASTTPGAAPLAVTILETLRRTPGMRSELELSERETTAVEKHLAAVEAVETPQQ